MSEGAIAGSLTRRQLLSMIGKTAGGAAMYQAMTSLGFAADSGFRVPSTERHAPRSVGAGPGRRHRRSGRAYELRNAGYQVQVLEYNSRAGGRNWTLRGGDTLHRARRLYPAMRVRSGLYINPGSVAPSLPSPRHAELLQALGVQLEPSCR